MELNFEEMNQKVKRKLEIIKNLKKCAHKDRKTRAILKLEKYVKRQSMCLDELIKRSETKSAEGSEDNIILEKNLKDTISNIITENEI